MEGIKDDVLKLKEYEQEIIWIHGRAFIIQPATEEDVERIGKGYYCMD